MADRGADQRWEIVSRQRNTFADEQAVEALLMDGWEPFAVDGGKVYLRRQVAEQEPRSFPAGPMPSRSLGEALGVWDA